MSHELRPEGPGFLREVQVRTHPMMVGGEAWRRLQEQIGNRTGHDVNCEWQCDQRPIECTCGVTAPRTPGFVPYWHDAIWHMHFASAGEISEVVWASLETVKRRSNPMKGSLVEAPETEADHIWRITRDIAGG